MSTKRICNKLVSIFIIVTFTLVNTAYSMPLQSQNTLRVQQQLSTSEGQKRYTKAFWETFKIQYNLQKVFKTKEDSLEALGRVSEAIINIHNGQLVELKDAEGLIKEGRAVVVRAKGGNLKLAYISPMDAHALTDRADKIVLRAFALPGGQGAVLLANPELDRKRVENIIYKIENGMFTDADVKAMVKMYHTIKEIAGFKKILDKKEGVKEGEKEQAFALLLLLFPGMQFSVDGEMPTLPSDPKKRETLKLFVIAVTSGATVAALTLLKRGSGEPDIAEIEKAEKNVNNLIQDFKNSDSDAEDLHIMRQILNLEGMEEYALMLAILTELGHAPYHKNLLIPSMKDQYGHYIKDYFFGKFLKVMSMSSDGKQDLAKLKIIIEKIFLRDPEIIKRSIGISKLYESLIAHALFISYRMAKDDKIYLFNSVGSLFSQFAGHFEAAESSKAAGDIVVDFLSSHNFVPSSVRIDIINHVTDLGITFGGEASVPSITRRLELLSKFNESEEVREAARNKLEQIRNSKGEKQESLDILDPNDGTRVNTKIVRRAVPVEAAGLESGPNSHKFVYREDTIEEWGYVRFDFNDSHALNGYTMEINVEGVQGKKRIREFGITFVHEGRDFHRLPVHIKSIDVSKDGIVRIDIPEEIKGVDLTKIVTFFIHVAEMFDEGKTTFDNSKGSEILVKSIRFVPKVEQPKKSVFPRRGFMDIFIGPLGPLLTGVGLRPAAQSL